MFVDSAIITVKSGGGGNGSSHFFRGKGIPKGGPDGGDGGNGGDVIMVADRHLDTLVEFAYKPHWMAKDGEGGSGANCYGRAAEPCIIRVPLGCQVFDAATDELVTDIVELDQRVVVAPGGKGGRGNNTFKSAIHQAPTERELGGESVTRELRLELKLIADVGLVGLPNAGKSTLLKATTRAQPKVADYPFTTLSPQLGIAELPGDRRLVIADLPGLIEGAAHGAGLGHDFLRHIERTRAIVHMIDCLPPDGSDPFDSHKLIRNELATFSHELARKPEIVLLNKLDLMPESDRAAFVKAIAPRLKRRGARAVLGISGATGDGVHKALEAAWEMVAAARGPGDVTPTDTASTW
ncbi:MAG: GTPase ObgE [Planctomycetota bacterium]|nr:GTPase ObgE [Planctomycetota bacterium]MDA1105522.1 GTPase ObgE [Planctomycetota bacterium]